jgi:hypothetical protein
VQGLDSVKDTDGNVIREARLAAWANFRQRALNVAIAQINAKTDLKIAIESIERAAHSFMPPDLANQFNPLACQAEFTYSITPKTITIQDTGKGKKCVADDLEAVLRKIEYWHQGSIARFRISYVSAQGAERPIEWDGQTARVRPLE